MSSNCADSVHPPGRIGKPAFVPFPVAAFDCSNDAHEKAFVLELFDIAQANHWRPLSGLSIRCLSLEAGLQPQQMHDLLERLVAAGLLKLDAPPCRTNGVELTIHDPTRVAPVRTRKTAPAPHPRPNAAQPVGLQSVDMETTMERTTPRAGVQHRAFAQVLRYWSDHVAPAVERAHPGRPQPRHRGAAFDRGVGGQLNRRLHVTGVRGVISVLDWYASSSHSRASWLRTEGSGLNALVKSPRRFHELLELATASGGAR